MSQICGLRREEKDGTCLGQLTFPSSWWPSMMRQNRQKYDTSKAEMKQPKTLVDVKYSVFESRSGKSCQELGPTDKDPGALMPRFFINWFSTENSFSDFEYGTINGRN